MNTLYIVFILGLFFSLQLFPSLSLSGQNIDLGTFSPSNISGSRASPDRLPPEEAFNGITNTNGDGWLGVAPTNQRLNFDFNLKEHTDFNSNTYDTVQLTLKIWSGNISDRVAGSTVFIFRGIESFFVRVTDQGGFLDLASPITDFVSYSGEKLTPTQDAIDMTLNSQTGLISTEVLSDSQALYTIVFNAPSTTGRLRINFPTSEIYDDFYTVEEVELSGVVVVPEPSTYGLLFALCALFFYRFKRSKR